jgi:Ni,Fe-hydrogenase I small subunit
MKHQSDWLSSELQRRGVTRREFVGFCTAMASALALPADPAVVQKLLANL